MYDINLLLLDLYPKFVIRHLQDVYKIASSCFTQVR